MNWKKHLGFFVILVLLGVASFQILRDYIGMFFLALVLVIVFEPLYKWYLKKFRRAGVASLLTALTIILLLVLPFFLAITLAANQAVSIVRQMQRDAALQDETVQALLIWIQNLYVEYADDIQSLMGELDVDLAAIGQKALATVSGLLTGSIVPAVGRTVKVVVDFTIFFMVLIYLFPLKERMFKAIADIAPVSRTIYQQFIRRFEGVTKGTIKGTIMIAITQGILGALMLWILGAPAPAFWGLMMAVAALIPLGSALVWVPIAIVMLIAGQYVNAAVWFIYSILVISSVDNVVRPKVMEGGEAGMPELLTLLSVLGGVKVFGFTGFIFGPVIVGLFLTSLEIYREHAVRFRKASST